MPTTTNKQRLLTQLFASQKKSDAAGDYEPRPVLEQFIYGLCREGATRERADRAFQNLREWFFDWNEVRVSSLRELEEAFAGLSRPAERAQRLISFLQEVFETTFSFDLDGLNKKGLKQASKQLARFQAADDYIVSWVVQQSLGSHAIPLDAPMLRVAHRLGLIDEEEDCEAVRTSMEHLVPKARANQFYDAISAVGNDFCFKDEPDCLACPLVGECGTGQENTRLSTIGARTSRTKPR